MSYLSLLPNELLLELSLYFNYRDSILYCDIWKCDLKFWLNKIQKELGYSDEFIREYIYDTSTNTMKTLMSINEKYLELKVRSKADFGTELYQFMDYLFVSSSRLKDFQYADELTLYLLYIYKYRHPAELIDAYSTAARGAISVDNINLADKVINQYYEVKRELSTMSIERDIFTHFTSPIVSGIYENGNLDLFDHYNINEKNVEVDQVIKGLATGGHLEQLRQYEGLLNTSNLLNAAQLGHSNIIYHYQWLLNEPRIIASLINFGHLQPLPSIRNLSKNIQEIAIKEFIENGYIEELIKYQDLITVDIAKNGIWICLLYNHIDTVNFLYKLYPKEIKTTIKTKIIFNLNLIYNMTISTFEYLFNNEFITINDIANVGIPILSIMNKYNADTVQYLLNYSQ